MRYAIAITLALIFASLAHADQYGFTNPPYTYDREYRHCAWPDDGTGRRYRPGYEEDRRRSNCDDGKAVRR